MSPARSNTLWLMSEDRSSHPAAYGDPLARMPTVDRLAREGVVFDLCTSPVCAPLRFALITGVFAMSCGPAQYMQARPHLQVELTTYVQELRGAGYCCRKQWA